MAGNAPGMLMGLALSLWPLCGWGATFYVDPLTGADTNNGSVAAPWKTVQHLFDANLIESWEWDSRPYTESSVLVRKNSGAPVKAGDTILLRSGSYGELIISSYYNTTAIRLAADTGATPVFQDIILQAGSNWVLSGLTIDASAFAAHDATSLLTLRSHTWYGPVQNITISGCLLRSVADSSAWTLADWNDTAKIKNGIIAGGTGHTISSNTLININHGISLTATHSLVQYNTVTNFAGDGLRGLGDYTVFQYNTVKNCYDVNDNHDDGFQSWSVGSDGEVGTGVVRGIVLRGNTIINYEDSSQPFRGSLQGIGCFDGMYDGWVIEDNTVVVDSWHGISLYGATNALVRRNIVIDSSSGSPGPPWIRLNRHKNGTLSSNNQVSCNVAAQFIDDEGVQNLFQNNTVSSTGGQLAPGCQGGLLPLLTLPALLPHRH